MQDSLLKASALLGAARWRFRIAAPVSAAPASAAAPAPARTRPDPARQPLRRLPGRRPARRGPRLDIDILFMTEVSK